MRHTCSGASLELGKQAKSHYHSNDSTGILVFFFTEDKIFLTGEINLGEKSVLQIEGDYSFPSISTIDYTVLLQCSSHLSDIKGVFGKT